MIQNLLYQRHIQRLERKLTRFGSSSNRFSWARMIAFLAGGAATWGAYVLSGSKAGWIVFFSAAAMFMAIVALHRRLDQRVESFRIWKELYQEKLARLELDWEHIPPPVTPALEPRPAMSVDLDLTGLRSLHHLLDTSISCQGSQRLADWLGSDRPDPGRILTRQAVVRELGGLARFRNRLRLIFRQLSREPLDGDKLLDWLKTPTPDQSLGRLLPWGTLLALTNLILFILFASGLLPPYWFLTTLAYAGVYLTYKRMIAEFLEAVLRLDDELGKFLPLLRFLEQFPYGTRAHLEEQCAPFLDATRQPSQRLRQLRFVTALVGMRMNPILGLLLNLLTPWDFWAAWLAARQRQLISRLLPAWLEAFHELEALTALGEFAALHPEHAFPVITALEEQPRPSAAGGTASQPIFAARSLGHPLLPPAQKVCNDLRIEALGELILITGSNMSGKSTFIRSVGINLCLAYAGGPVNALEMETLPFRLFTCIRINDSLVDGFSYFYAEVKRLKGLLDALKPGSADLPLLYLIDEIFRGTNNRERLTGSRAFVKALVGAAGVGLIATHDLELATLADNHPQMHNAHFRDEVSAGKLTFDYLLRPGPTPSTNALKIMANEGLPVDG